MSELLKVKKWGGENAAELEQSPANVVKDFREWIKQAVVVSAIRSRKFNTTDKLIEIWDLLWLDDVNINEVIYKVNKIRNFHLKVVSEKISNTESKMKLQKLIVAKFEEFLEDLVLYISYKWTKIKPSKQNDYLISTGSWDLSILWFWEELSALVQTEVINSLRKNWLEAETVKLDWVFDDLEASEIYRELSDKISSRVDEILSMDKVAIVPWYIPWSEEGIEKMVWRWYSDATAAMTAVWLSKWWAEVTLEIQKSVNWMMSADPSLLEEWSEPKLIEQIDYITAKEITGIRWAQAKLLHSQVLRRQLQEAWVKVHLFNPFENTKGTIISEEKSEKSRWVEFIWARDNVIFFSISSWHMEDLWILAKVFDIVQDYKPVDIVSTSETEISFTINNNVDDSVLDEMKEKIRKKLWFEENDERNKIEYVRNKALIYCIWQNLSHSMWTLAQAATCLSKWGINIELVSQWAKERAMVFWIDSWEEWENMKEAVNLLHKEFID